MRVDLKNKEQIFLIIQAETFRQYCKYHRSDQLRVKKQNEEISHALEKQCIQLKF